MMQCRFCRGNDLKPWAGRYQRCNDCLYICSVPPPTDKEISEHYAHYHEKNHQASEKKNKSRARSYIQEIQWLKSQLGDPFPGPVFDYGASGGYFLDALVTHGGINKDLAFGDDLSFGAVEQLAAKGYHRSVDTLVHHSMGFVVLRGVLEHLMDFRTMIKQLTDLVADDGAFFITATPDAGSTVANVYREDWVQHHYPSHFQHFTSALVDQLLAEVDFILIDHVDLYRDSIYRSDEDDANWLATNHGQKTNKQHAYWGSMMTRLYRKIRTS